MMAGARGANTSWGRRPRPVQRITLPPSGFGRLGNNYGEYLKNNHVLKTTEKTQQIDNSKNINKFERKIKRF